MTNETIFFISVLADFSFVFFCFLFGRRWLYTAIIVNLLAISIFGAEVISVFGWVTNVGNVFYAAVFTAGQLLVEHYGKEEGKKSIWVGLGSVVFIIVAAQVVIQYTPIESLVTTAGAIKTLFLIAPRIAVASLLAYLVSQSLNIYLYNYVTHRARKELWLRSLVANVLGQFVDSFIFFLVAFWMTLPPDILLQSLLVGFEVKMLVGLLAIPLLYQSYRFKSSREVLEQEAEAVMSSIADGVIMTDMAGKIILVNHAFTNMLGWYPHEVLGKLMTDVVAREDDLGNPIPYEERVLTKVLRGQIVLVRMANHSYFVRKDGTRFPVTILVNPILIDGKIKGAVEVFRDVSYEREIETLRNDFLALASHQLRTPLSGTRWLIEALQEEIFGKLNEKQKIYISQLYATNSKLIQLTSDMLNVLRLQSGKIRIKKTPFTLRTLFDDVKALASPMAQKRNITIVYGKQDSMQLATDFNLVKSIMESLVSNAINYSVAGKTVSIASTESPDDVTIFVKDEGIGIPENEKRRVFDRFYRASNAQKMKTDGTGLGLYTASILAKSIGATITFESREGIGSTFYLKIPKEKSDG